MAHTRNYSEVIRAQLVSDPALADAVDEEIFNAELASKLYEARVSTGLTQKELATLVGTKQSVISRIEDADYYGRSLTLLRRIARALKMKLRLEFIPDTGRRVQNGSPIKPKRRQRRSQK